MAETVTIRVAGPIDAASLFREPACGGQEGPGGDAPVRTPEAHRQRCAAEELERQKTQLAQLCQTVNSICSSLDELHRETLAQNRAEIARLALEIARRILPCRVDRGDYNMQGIVEEALKRAPTQQKIVVRLNPADVPSCQQLQQESPESPFANLELVADWSVGRGECLVETPKGIVKSFMEEHLERIGEALRTVE
jgi:flagellar assembly protein FliH